MKVLLGLIIATCASGVAFADAPKKSLRPMPRPVLVQPLAAAPLVQSAGIALPEPARLRPQRRPAAIAVVTPDASLDASPDANLAATPETMSTAAPGKPRKGLLGMLAPRAKPTRKSAATRAGSVCGVPSIKGKVLPRVTSKTNGCGVDDPVSITAIDGVRLSQPATLDCPTAIALNKWVQTGLRPAFGRNEVVELKVAAHYSCRSRNNVRGAKISEHGRGKAIDISGFVLSNGKEMSVQGNFNKTIRKAHKAACGVFKTTLGPGSDGYHEDHLHFDTSSRKGGAYCR